MKKDVVIIGGGAAGMFAACCLQPGSDAILVEPNPKLGKKLRITGKGRCNVTNACEARAFLNHVPRNGKFLYSALHALSPEETMARFAAMGLAWKIERGNRVFPVSDNAHEVADVLQKKLLQNGVRICHARAVAVEAEQGAVSAVLLQNGEKIACKKVLLATGGASYPGTGSTGDGYRMAQALGHTVISPQPSLVPLQERGDSCAGMQGLSLRNVRLTAYENQKRIFEEQGELLFTHFGLSGPLVLSASAHMRHFDKKQYRVEIDLKPALDTEALDKRLLSDFEKYKNSDFCNALGDLLPHKLIPEVIRRSEIPPRVKVHSVTREQRRALIEVLKHFTVEISGPRPIAEAIVTSGGVSVKEVDPRTMESKLVSGLYFAGELLDVDAYTGGFNLQIAWSTAAVAAAAMQADKE